MAFSSTELSAPSFPITSSEIMALEDRHASGVTSKRPAVIVRGLGATVWDADGRSYIDCMGGHGAMNVGHSHPHIVQAITEQAKRLMLCPDSLYNDQRAHLLARLATLAPPGLDRAFLCNSGAEAVEAALKFARLSTGRAQILAARNGFHGRTMGALSATWKPQYRQPFAPLVPQVSHFRYNDLADLEATISADTAAVLLEVVQGEGGVVVGDGAFLQGAAHLCQQTGALLIIDEVQTGLGRTGLWWACEHDAVTPDLMPIAKSLGGGFPIGACLVGERVGQIPSGSHGSTFGGNPLACAAAHAVLDVLSEEDLIAHSAKVGQWFQARLRALATPLIREVRGLGLMVGLDLRIKATPILKALQEKGILALAAGPTVIRFLPPLTISQQELSIVVDTLADLLIDEEH